MAHPSNLPNLKASLCLLPTLILLLANTPLISCSFQDALELRPGPHHLRRSTFIRGSGAEVVSTLAIERSNQPGWIFVSEGVGAWGNNEEIELLDSGTTLGRRISGSSLKKVDLAQVTAVSSHENGTDQDVAVSDGQGGGPSHICHVSACPTLSRCRAPEAPGLDAGIEWCRMEDMVGLTAPNRHPNRTLTSREGPYPSVHPHSPDFNALDACFTVQLGHVIAVGPPSHIVRPECHALQEEEHQNNLTSEWDKDLAGHVFVLEDVFLDSWGRVFNATHQFHAGGCATQDEISYDSDTPTAEMEFVINLMGAASSLGDGQLLQLKNDRASHLRTTAHELPLALLIASTFPLPRGAVLATHHRKFHHIVTSQLLNGSSKAAFRAIKKETPEPGTLWLVKKLVLPAQQSCQKLSFPLWESSRKQHLLHTDLLSQTEAQQPLPLVPPSAPLVLPGWRIVVHDHVLVTVSSDPLLPSIITRFFPPERVTVSSRRQSVDSDQSLFSRAPLFVTTTLAPSSLSNIIFMPLHSTALLLEDSSDPEAPVVADLAVQLAAACQVRLYRVRCSRATGTIHCDPNAFLEVLDRVAIDVYTVLDPPPLHHPPTPFQFPTEGEEQTQDPAGRRELAMGAQKHQQIAGTGTLQNQGSSLQWQNETESQRKEYQDWADCVSREGSWVHNPTPRHLPWEYRETPDSASVCDIKHAHNGGIAGDIAEQVVELGGSAADWSVRDSVKYTWQVPEEACPRISHRVLTSTKAAVLQEFTAESFCNDVGRERTLLFLGDSLTQQTVASFLNLMLMGVPKPAEWAVTFDIPQECRDWLPDDSKAKHPYCGRYRFAESVCPGLTVYFVRNDYLTLPNPRSADRLQFSRLQALVDADVIVLNRGAHFEEDDKYTRDLTAVLRYLRNRFPQTLVVFRNTPPGHVNCTSISEPLTRRQEAAILPESYGWAKFQHQNGLAKEIVRKYGYAYIDVDTMTALRGDGHKGKKPWDGSEDCLHYCLPGPIDLWNQLLYNTLLWVAPIR